MLGLLTAAVLHSCTAAQQCSPATPAAAPFLLTIAPLPSQLGPLRPWPLALPAQQAPRRRFTTRQRTSRFMGVGSSNRKNQWQARILVHGKVTHLGYYETEEEAARVYDRCRLVGITSLGDSPGVL